MTTTQGTPDLTALNRTYWQQGYIVLRGLFSPSETQAWGAECDRLLEQDWVDPANVRTPFRMNSEVTPERIDPVVDVSPLFSQLVQDERITGVLRALWNDEAVYSKTN
jgi:hypothetical protein